MSVIKCENLSKRYGEVEALTDVELEVKEGEFFGLLGPNGAGKTTLLKILTCQLKSSEGKAEVFGLETYNHFKDIKSPYATSVQAGKDQDNQAWGGTCCNYGKVGWTYIWQKSGGYCTFSTYVTDTELIYDEVKWSD